MPLPLALSVSYGLNTTDTSLWWECGFPDQQHSNTGVSEAWERILGGAGKHCIDLEFWQDQDTALEQRCMQVDMILQVLVSLKVVPAFLLQGGA